MEHTTERRSQSPLEAQVATRTGLWLVVGQTVSTMIAAITIILIVRTIGPSQYGVYAIALMPAAIMATFRDWGVTVGLTKHLAESRARKNLASIRGLVLAAFAFEMTTGVLLTIFTWWAAGFAASALLKTSNATPLFQIAASYLLLFGISNTSSAALLGLQQTRYTCLLDILLALMKGGLSLWLVSLGWESFGVLTGLLLAQSVVALVGFVLVMLLTRRTSTAVAEGSLGVRTNIKILFRYGFYLGITTVLSSFGAQLYNILTALSVTSTDIGYYTASQDVLALVVVLAVPLQSALLPSFSKIDGNRQPDVLNGAFRSSIRYTSYVVLPLASMVTGLAIPLATTVFGPTYLACGIYLGYSGLIFLLAGLGSLSVDNLLMSQDKTKAILATKAVGLFLSIPLCFFVIPFFGVIGLITTRLFDASLTMLLELVVIYIVYRMKPDGLLAVKLLLSSGLTIATLVFLSQLLAVSGIIEVLLTGLAGLGIFFAVLFGLRGIRLADIRLFWNLITARSPPRRMSS